MRETCYSKNSGSLISGHKYMLIRNIAGDKIGSPYAELKIGEVNNDDWWCHVLADRNINGYASSFPKHFKKVCKCRKFIRK